MIDVQYSLAHGTVKGLADESSFLLSNNAGSFFYHDWKTRNGGWFVHDEDTFRVIAEMRTASPQVSAIIHSGSKVEMKKNGIREMFTLPEGKNVLVYKTNTPLDTDIFLDVRKLNDNRQWGRHYNIKVEGGKTIIHFMKSTDAREDKTTFLNPAKNPNCMIRVYEFIKYILPGAEGKYGDEVDLLSRFKHRHSLTTVFLSEPIFSMFEAELIKQERNDQSLDGHLMVDGVIVLGQTHPKVDLPIVIDVHGHYPVGYDPFH